MTAIVLDASVAVKLVAREPDSALALVRVGEASAVIAPDWITLEVAHALWKKVQAAQLDAAAAEAGTAALGQIIDRMVPAQQLISAAVRLSYDLPHPLYDCLYLVLAQAEDVRVLTADVKFARVARAGGLGDYVEHLGEAS
ncbi:MAG: type II toxin-antitoxin system VapC family toxin [Sphingomonas sp.]